MTTPAPRQPPKARNPRVSLTPIEIRWPTVALVALVVAGIVAVFAFAGPDERSDLLGILAVLGTAGAAVMRAAFGAQPAPAPKRIDDDSDANGGVVEGGVLDDGPPARPARTSVRRNTLLAVPSGLVLAALVGCSPSALQTHATIASITGHVFDTACTEVEVARSREQHTIADGPLDREASTAAVETVRAHWAPALASCELAADTHDAWVTALALAAAGAPFALADGIALATSALEVWRSLMATLAVAGVEMPALPAELVALTGGAL